GFNGAVAALERFNDQTYAGGVFNTSSFGVNRIARWNEATGIWESVGSGMNGPVYALRTYNGQLYAGGSFTTAGGVSTGGLARWDGANWTACGGFFLGTVYALEIHNGVLAIGGSFPGFGGSPNLSSYDGFTYANFGTGGTDAPVRSLAS